MSRIWSIDKLKEIASFIDYDLLYFSTATYMDKANTIIASFDNIKAGDTENNGSLVYSPYEYDEGEDLSIKNNPYILYRDVDRQNQVHFYFSSGVETDSSGHYIPDGNIVGLNTRLNLVVGAPISLVKTIELTDVIPAIVLPNGSQIPGEAWIVLASDNAEYGLNWHPDYETTAIAPNSSTWQHIVGSWTDADITINKSKFWNRDLISPS